MTDLDRLREAATRPRYYGGDPYPYENDDEFDAAQEQAEADLAYIVALVNGHAEGTLVPVAELDHYKRALEWVFTDEGQDLYYDLAVVWAGIVFLHEDWFSDKDERSRVFYEWSHPQMLTAALEATKEADGAMSDPDLNALNREMAEQNVAIAHETLPEWDDDSNLLGSLSGCPDVEEGADDQILPRL